MKTKPFDQKLYNDNDSRAKKKAIEVLSEDGFIVEEGTQYGTDLKCYLKDGTFAFMIECEVKICWKKDNYIFPDMHIPFRKKKNFDTDVPTYMFLINDIETSYAIIWKDDIMAAPLKESPNKYNATGEFFFAVPLEKIDFHIGEI
jgi:hypothetical protein